MKKQLHFAMTVLVSAFAIPAAVQAAPTFLSDNGHYYEFFSPGNVTRADAAAGAATHSFMGVMGHLATITSAAENALVRSLGGGWLGGSRSGSSWTWDTGEGEFWVGASGGSASVSGLYANWDNGTGEPNNAGGNEPFLLMRSTGFWQDYNGFQSDVGYYVVEYDTAIPEPGTLSLLAGAGCALLLAGRRRPG